MNSSEAITPPAHEPVLYGSRLRSARSFRQLAAKDVAADLCVSPATLSRLEKSDSTVIDVDQLTQISFVLGFPRSWFSEAPRAFAANVQPHFRAGSRMTKKSMDEIKCWWSALAEMVATIDRSVNLKPSHLPSHRDPVQGAIQLRESMGFAPSEPIPHLIRAAERMGVYVGTCGFDEELHLKNHDASSDWANLEDRDSVPIVLCREHSSWERTRFSFAHELGHLVLHRFGGSQTKEQEATEFAAELLVPSSSLHTEWPSRPTILQLLPMKQKWGISIAALIMHGHRNGLITDAKKTSLFKQLSNGRNPYSNKRWRQDEPGSKERKVERPLLIANAIEVGYGLPPDLDAFYRDLPRTNGHEIYREFLPNFECTWSRELNSTKYAPQNVINEPQPDFAWNDNVISADFAAHRRYG